MKSSMNINNERRNKVVEYYNKNHSLEDSLSKYKVNDKTMVSGSNYLMTCPFHDDKSPSFSANYSRGVFKCFSCGEGGGVCKFEYLYQSRVLGGVSNFNIFVDNLLKKDSVMMSQLGFNTIFENSSNMFFGSSSDIEFKRSFKPSECKEPKTYIQIADKMIKCGYNESQLKEFILLMQGGISVEDINKSMFYKNSFNNVKVEDCNIFNISDMLGDD